MKAGDVVVVPYFRHQDDKGGEPRWIILVEDLQDSFEVVPLTKNTQQIYRYPKSFIVDLNSLDGISMGLQYNSLVIPDRKTTILKSILKGCLVKGTCKEEFLDNLISKI